MTLLADREAAARLLARRLRRLRGTNPLVLAVPRGAVPMGRILAEELNGELDLVLVHKLGAPGEPELAIGAVDEAGEVLLHRNAALLGVDQGHVREEARRQLEELRRRRALYTPERPPLDPAGRVVVVIDDGAATGSTLEAALRAVRVRGPTELIAAAGVMPKAAAVHLADLADEVVCALAPEGFQAVGQFFREFRQVSDAEVVEVLRDAERAARGRG